MNENLTCLFNSEEELGAMERECDSDKWPTSGDVPLGAMGLKLCAILSVLSHYCKMILQGWCKEADGLISLSFHKIISRKSDQGQDNDRPGKTV